MVSGADVLAAIVSWNCDEGIAEALHALRGQVGAVLILDNHSCEESLRVLKQLENEPACTVVYGAENAGIAVRLNEALAYAAAHGYRLLLTMDQDAVLCEGCVQSLLSVLNENPAIAAVGPYQSTLRSIAPHPDGYMEKDYLITAGCLVLVQEAQACGGYMTQLFVDMVDIAFSLSLRSHGHKLALATNARMEHEVGVYETRSILGLRFRYLSHSPARYYSMFRNTRFTVRMFLRKYPLFCVKLLLVQDVAGLRTIFENNGIKKVRAAWKGILDGWLTSCGRPDGEA